MLTIFPVIDASKEDRAGLRAVVSINLVVDICSVCPIRVALSLRIPEMRPRSHVGSVLFPVSSPPWLMGTQGLPTLNRVYQDHLSWDLPCDLKTYSVFKLETATEGWAKALSSERRVKCGCENWSRVYSGCYQLSSSYFHAPAFKLNRAPLNLIIEFFHGTFSLSVFCRGVCWFSLRCQSCHGSLLPCLCLFLSWHCLPIPFPANLTSSLVSANI